MVETGGARIKRPGQAATALTYLCLLAAPLAIGGVHPPVAAALAALAIVILFLQLVGARPSATWPVLLPTVGFGLLSVTCVLQLIPLPEIFHKFLNPRGWELYQVGWNLAFGEASSAPSLRPLSLAPQQTADRLMRWVCLGLFAVIGAKLGRRRRGFTNLLYGVIATAGVILAVGLYQRWRDTEELLGFYEPVMGGDTLSVFVSANHAASYFGLASLAALALASRRFRKSRKETAVTLGLAAIFMLAMFDNQSAGAVVAYGLGVVLLVLDFLLRRSAVSDTNPLQRHRLSIAIAAGLVGVIALAAGWIFYTAELPGWLQNTTMSEWFADKGEGRLLIAHAAAQASFDFWPIGAGAGGVGRVICPYIDWSELLLATIPVAENEFAEWLLTMGWPVTLLVSGSLLSLFGWLGYRLWVRQRTGRYLQSFALALYLLVIAQFHFPFLALGVSLPAVVLISAGAVSREKGAIWWEVGQVNVRRSGIWKLLAMSSLMLIVAFVAYYSIYQVDPRFTVFRQPAGSVHNSLSVDETREFLPRIPTESNIYLYLGARYAASGDHDRAILVTEHAYRLRPHNATLVRLAHIQAGAGQHQEAVETYRRVLGQEFFEVRLHWVTGFLLRDLSSASARAAALEGAQPRLWEYALQRIDRRDGGLAAVAFALELSELHRDDHAISSLLGKAYILDKQYELAEMWANSHLGSARKGDAWAHQLLLQALWHQREGERARRAAIEALTAHPEDTDIQQWALRVRTEDPALASIEFADTFEVAQAKYCKPPIDDERRQILCWASRAWLLEYQKNLEEAEIIYERLARRHGSTRPLAWFFARHRLCEELSDFARTWQRRHGADPPGFPAGARRCAEGVLAE